MKTVSVAEAVISSLFGLVALFLGILNMFWGNDFWYGLMLLLLALLFFPPVGTLVYKLTRIRVAPWMKLLLAAFIIWTAMGVGEFFHKLEMMKASL